MVAEDRIVLNLTLKQHSTPVLRNSMAVWPLPVLPKFKGIGRILLRWDIYVDLDYLRTRLSIRDLFSHRVPSRQHITTGES